MYFNDERSSTNIDTEFDKKNKFKFNFNFFNKKYLIYGLITVILGIGILLLILKLSKREYYLVLNGLDDIIVYQNSEYVEPGYQAYDNKNNDYTSDVLVTGEVDTSVVGEYKIIYSFKEIVKERIVTVIGDINHVTFLNLLGEKIVYLNIGETYKEPGYVVLDSIDTNLEERVVVMGRVDTNKAGTYKLVYSVINTAGITITAERTVIVMDSEFGISYSPEGYTTGDVTIKTNVVSNYFDYILLPNGSKSNNRNTEYKISANGEYNFTLYNKDGSTKTVNIKIMNIDKNAPNISSCSAEISTNTASIRVNATDQGAGIKEYKYFVNNQMVSQGKNNSYLYNGATDKSTQVKVAVVDKAGNLSEKACSVKYLEPSIDNENVTVYTVGNHDYIVPKTRTDLQTFVNRVEGKISQTALSTCHDACLSVAMYHGYMIKYGDLNSINVNDACTYKYDEKFRDQFFDTSQGLLYKVYEEINAGRPIVIQVKGSAGRHFVLAVGYKRTVYKKENITENDILIIDAWDGKLEVMDKTIDPNARELYHKPNERWRTEVFK